MSGESTLGIREVSGGKLSVEFIKVSLHGDTRDCPKPHSIEKRNRGGQGLSRVDLQLTYP